MERMGRFARRGVGIAKAARIDQPALPGDGHRKTGDAAGVHVSLNAVIDGIEPRGGESAVAGPGGVVVSFGPVVVRINEHRPIALIVGVEVLRGEIIRRHPVDGPTFAAIEFSPHAGKPFHAARREPVDADESVALTTQRVERGLIRHARLVVTELHVRHVSRGPHPGVKSGAAYREGAEVVQVKCLRLVEIVGGEMGRECLPQRNPLGCSAVFLPDAVVERGAAYAEAIEPDQPEAGGMETVMRGHEGRAIQPVMGCPRGGLAAFLEDRRVARLARRFAAADAGRPVPIRWGGPEVELGLPGRTAHSMPFNPGQRRAGGGEQAGEKSEQQNEERRRTIHGN